ncbi:MAG: AAA family ATPase [Labilithrix sp.]|nr:AAA family ATPase [Labilithrix sp.]
MPRAAVPPPFDVVDAAGIAEPLPPVPYVIPALGFARSSAPNMIAGYGYSRKTLALQDAALAVATGGLVWGRYPCEQTTVLHVDYEQGSYLSRKRYQRLAHARGVDLAALGDRLRFTTSPRIYLDGDKAEDAYSRLLDGVGFAFVDSLKAATPATEENNSAVRVPLDMLLRVSEKTGTCIVVVHHARKPSRDDVGGAKAILRGSSAIFDACSSVLTFSSDAGEATDVQQPKQRWTGKGLEAVRLDSEDTDDGRGLRVVVRDVDGTAIPPWQDAIRGQIVAIVAKTPGLSKTAIYANVLGNAKRRAEAMASLIADGTITYTGGKARLAAANDSSPLFGGGNE